MLVLASRSPRRREILQQAGIPFVVRPVEVDETPLPGEAARDYVTRIAREKASAAAAAPGEIVLGADTTVVIHGEILGKPLDAASGEPMDKAGAYAIQGLASKFIQCIEGCYFNVMGLPVAMIYRHLREM